MRYFCTSKASKLSTLLKKIVERVGEGKESEGTTARRCEREKERNTESEGNERERGEREREGARERERRETERDGGKV